MKELLVSAEQNGKLIPVGKITGNNLSDARFRYFDVYRLSVGAPISISLPLQEDAFSAEQTASFFR